MSSAIPIRRITRTTRATTLRDNENANARPSRLTSRGKPSSLTDTNAPAGVSRATTATAASRAKAGAVGDSKLDPAPQGKRKREALAEINGIVTNNKAKNVDAGAGTLGAKVSKIKAKVVSDGKPDDSALKGKKTAAIPSNEPRVPLRTVAGTAVRQTIRSTVVSVESKPVQKSKDEHRVQVHQDNVVPADLPAPVPRLISTRKIVPAQTTTHAVTRHTGIYRHSSKLVARQQQIERELEEDHVCKKRRTSSEPPEDEVKTAEEEPLQQEPPTTTDFGIEAYADEEEVEADPEGDQWEDLDAEDADDPLMVSEYVIDIVKYMKELEIVTLPNPRYMDSQKDLHWNMRGILTDWLITIHIRFRLLPETLYLCVNIIDRFLSARVVSLAKLQLVGVTCMFIAAKVEEICSPSVSAFFKCADSSYTQAEILQAERYILKTLEWNLSFPNPVHFLRRVSKADDYDVNVRTVAKYLLEIPCLEWRLLATPPSLTAAASIWLARLVLARGPWTPNLAHYSGYSESALLPTVNLMLNYILRGPKHDAFYKKYAGKRFFKSSVYMRQWALKRWPDHTAVDLKAELPHLKAESVLIREQSEAAAAASSTDSTPPVGTIAAPSASGDGTGP